MATERITRQIPCIECPLLTCAAFSPPDEAQRRWLQEFKAGEISLGRGDLLLAQGQLSGAIYTVVTGVLIRFRLLEDGRRQILNFMFPGDLIGLQGAFDEPMAHGVEALTNATLCVFPRDRLFELVVNHPRLSFDVIWLAAKEEASLDEHLVSLGQRSAAERMAYLAVWLVQRGSDTGVAQGGVLEIVVTQSQVADMLGLSLVHTNRTLQALRRQGLVQWTLTQIVVPNMAEAAAFAHFERPESVRPYL